MPLKIKLKPDEKIIVNGAVLFCGHKLGEMIFFNRARILRQSAVLSIERMKEFISGIDEGERNDVWFYYLIQLIYIDPENVGRYVNQLADTVSLLRLEFPDKHEEIDAILNLTAGGQLYNALRSCRETFPDCLAPNALDAAPEHKYDGDEESQTMTIHTKAYTKQPNSDNPGEIEAWGLMKAASLLEDACGDPGENGDAMREALRRNQLLWTIFQSAVADRETELPEDVRENILALSYVVDRRTFLCLGDLDADRVGFLIDLNRNIALGLMGHPGTGQSKEASNVNAPPKQDAVQPDHILLEA